MEGVRRRDFFAVAKSGAVLMALALIPLSAFSAEIDLAGTWMLS